MATWGASERKTPFASKNGVPANAEGERGCGEPSGYVEYTAKAWVRARAVGSVMTLMTDGLPVAAARWNSGNRVKDFE